MGEENDLRRGRQFRKTAQGRKGAIVVEVNQHVVDQQWEGQRDGQPLKGSKVPAGPAPPSAGRRSGAAV